MAEKNVFKKTLDGIQLKQIKDTTAPTVGSKALRVTNTTSNSITILWEKATDNVTAAEKIRYQVGLTEYNNSSDPWHTVRDAQGICSHTFTGLKPSTLYGFYVKAYDESGNLCQYPVENGCMTAKTAAKNAVTEDKEAPKASSQAINVNTITANSITISWKAATDNQTAASEITYTVYINKNSGGTWGGWSLVRTAKGITSYTASGLSPQTKYAFYVIATDKAGNKLFYPASGSKVVTTSGTATGTSSGSTDRNQEFRNYFKSIAKEDQIADVPVSKVEKPIKEYLVSGKQALQLFNEQHDINNPRDKFMPVNEANIFPGRLIYANVDLVNGKATTVDFYTKNQVGKVNVTVNFIASGTSLTETNVPATYNAIKDAVSNILSRALKTGALPPCEIESNVFTSNSKEKISVDLGCSVDYLGAKCKIDTSTTKSQESFYQLEEFTQVFYKVSVEAPNRDNVNYLGEGVTLKAYKDAKGNGPIAIIKSVSYGRIGLNMKKYDASSFTFKGSESASYQSYVEANSKQDIQQSSSTSTHFARVWGGSATTGGSAITNGMSKTGSTDDKTIDAAFSKELMKKMEFSMQNQGVPISYTVEYLASGRETGAFLTGQYLESKYLPLVNRLSFRIVQDASVLRGTNTISFAFEYSYIKLDADGRKIGTGTGSWEHKWSNTSEVNSVIELPQNCYFKDNEVFVRIRSRRAASAGLNKWKHCSTGYVNVTGGKLKLKMVGSYYSYSVRLGGDANDGWAQFK